MSRKGFHHADDLDLLAAPIQGWVIEKNWARFWPIQRFAIDELLRKRSPGDLILPAPTAGGKTMAAFLPLLSDLPQPGGGGEPLRGFDLLYVCPLKALIRQQGGAGSDIVTLATAAGRPVVPWMGDISGSVKERGWSRPQGGVLIITPESLEGRFLKRSSDLESRFGTLRAVIVDELHAYFESPRGPQLISLLTRLERAIGRPVQRVALSGTLGSGSLRDWEAIYRFLRPGATSFPPPPPSGTEEEHGKPPEIFLRVQLDEERTDQGRAAREGIATQLRRIFDRDKGAKAAKKGLIFTNSRREAERYANLLNTPANRTELPANWAERGAARQGEAGEADDAAEGRRPAGAGMDARFESPAPATDRRRYWPHHGSLDKSLRGEGERRMLAPEVACTLVATTTLELGIDIGAVEEVAQIGPGHSVASLRQRMGRSGRPTLVRDRSGRMKQLSPPPRLHVFLREPKLDESSHTLDRLRLPTFQGLAQISLLRSGQFEAPDLEQLHLSTFVQQLLSLLQQSRDGGLTQSLAAEVLVRLGPFSQLRLPLFEEIEGSISLFDAVLERLRTRVPPLLDCDLAASPDAASAEIFLTAAGEAVVRSQAIYAAFRTPIEYTLKAHSGILGTVGLGDTYGTGDRILFAGRAWEITSIQHAQRLIEVRPTSSGRAAYFTGDALVPSGAVVGEMKRLYALGDADFQGELAALAEVDATALEVLAEGRSAYRESDLEARPWVEVGDDLFLLPWVGHRTLVGLAAALSWGEMPASPFRTAIFVQDRTPEAVGGAIRRLLGGGPLGFPSLRDLARRGGSGATGKFDHFLSPTLWRRDYASWRLGSAAGIRSKLEELAAALP